MGKYFIHEAAVASNVRIGAQTPINTLEFTAVLQEAGRKNRNGRIYFKKVIDEGLKAPYVQERLETSTFYGEAGHPLDTSPKRQASIDHRNIAYIVKSWWWEGDLLMGKCETANTDCGRDMKGLIEQGCKVAFSLRARGDVYPDANLNAQVVASPIQIISFDWVINPSHDKAFIQSISESTRRAMSLGGDSMSLCESYYDNGNMVEIVNPMEKKELNFLESFMLDTYVNTDKVYIFNESDSIINITDNRNAILLENDDSQMLVASKDYLLKDIRNTLKKIGGDA